MMHVLEMTVATLVPMQNKLMSVAELRAVARTAFIREWDPGMGLEDITDERWVHPSHTWTMTRRSDGVAVLRIAPRTDQGSIAVTSRDGQARYRELTYLLDRPKKLHLLAGLQPIKDRRQPMLFKIVCTTQDRMLPF